MISGTTWPLPTDDGPGPWIEAGAVSPCREGIHACRIGDLAYWLHDELWEIELDGAIHESHHKVVAPARPAAASSRRVVSVALRASCRAGARGAAETDAVAVLNDVGESSWAEQLARAETLREVRRLARQALESLGDTTAGGVAAGLAFDAAALAPGDYVAMGPFVAAWAAANAVARRCESRRRFRRGLRRRATGPIRLDRHSPQPHLTSQAQGRRWARKCRSSSSRAAGGGASTSRPCIAVMACRIWVT